jgi:alpha-glucuronidase
VARRLQALVFAGYEVSQLEFERKKMIPARRSHAGFVACLAVALQLLVVVMAKAEDGYRLWLRYDPLPARMINAYRPKVTSIVVTGNSASAEALRAELVSGCSGLLGGAIPALSEATQDGAVVVGTPETSSLIKNLRWEAQLSQLGPEGFRIRSLKFGAHAVTVIAANNEVGSLYGAFYFLRLLQTLQPIDHLDVNQKPRLQLRMLDHWDNLDGSVERGYAGRSLWDWSALPDAIDPRLRDYARANASIGINGSLINNVNANAQILSADYLRKVAAIADVFRPFGVRIFLAARFSAPIDLGGLKTADPLDGEVAGMVEEKGKMRLPGHSRLRWFCGEG